MTLDQLTKADGDTSSERFDKGHDEREKTKEEAPSGDHTSDSEALVEPLRGQLSDDVLFGRASTSTSEGRKKAGERGKDGKLERRTAT